MSGDVEAKVAALTREFALAGAVGFSASPLGGVVATLSGAGGTAEVALRGGQVLSWLPVGSADVLWRNPGGRLDGPKPLRGGIPVCWPWFGAHPTDTAKPAHGVARNAMWHVVGTSNDGGQATLVLGLALGDSGRALWPEAGSVELEVVAGQALTVRLVTRNHGATPLSVTCALHTYLNIGDIEAVRVEGLQGATMIDRLAQDRRTIETGPVRFAVEVDRVYLDGGGDVVVVDEMVGRRLRVGRSGSRSVVVWTPWTAKAAKLGDVMGDDWRRILCVEAANAADDSVTIEPGGEHRLVTTLSAELAGE